MNMKFISCILSPSGIANLKLISFQLLRPLSHFIQMTRISISNILFQLCPPHGARKSHSFRKNLDQNLLDLLFKKRFYFRCLFFQIKTFYCQQPWWSRMRPSLQFLKAWTREIMMTKSLYTATSIPNTSLWWTHT